MVPRVCTLLGTCLSFSHEDSNLFVVGTEGGGLFKCSLHTSTATLVDTNTGLTLLAGSKSCSPFQYSLTPTPHDNLFLSRCTLILYAVLLIMTYCPPSFCHNQWKPTSGLPSISPSVPVTVPRTASTALRFIATYFSPAAQTQLSVCTPC